METKIEKLLEGLNEGKIQFSEVIAFIDAFYSYCPTAFKNGEVCNEKFQNEGSAKILYFGFINKLSVSDVLRLFAEHYEFVLQDPDGVGHQNIRQFIKNGWEGARFDGEVLAAKA